ncbi:hypothetical protein AB832_08375 [Flavobacteriaceae bacterium (ex Bugula neritina AB1)]|nr:hypothetical protein AB832_08375 [Flavobacteriaceae bacterium (ex Bugula neritina AB1)]
MPGKFIKFRIPEEKHEEYVEKAKEANMSMAEFIKEAVLNNRSIVVAKDTESYTDKKLYLLNKVSTDLFDIKHFIMSSCDSESLPEDTAAVIACHLEDIRKMLKEKFINDRKGERC